MNQENHSLNNQARSVGSQVPADQEYYKYWDRWSRRYDIVTWLSYLPFGGERRFRRSCVLFGGLNPKDKVLDLCCGTGSLTREIAELLDADGKVVGVDLSPHMLAKAQSKLSTKVGKSHTALVVSSADDLPFENGVFDRVFVSYGLHELPDEVRQKALFEVWRVLKNGGTFTIVDYNKAKNPVMRLGINLFVKWREEKSAWRMLCNNPLPSELKKIGFGPLKDKFPIGGVFRIFFWQKPLDASAVLPLVDLGQKYACTNLSCKECREYVCVYSREEGKKKPNTK